MYRSAQDKFWQVGQILDQNGEETEKEKESLKEQCFIRARAIAYIIQDRPEVVGDQEEIGKIADLLQVDEFHLFDTEGNLYAGTQPRYFGLNFRSGEQMRFFLPMLEDYDLQLCQDITPNTAEQKLMQYAAVWREDREGLVQVWLEPTTVLESMKKTELSYIFSLVTSEQDSTIYAIDADSHIILGSTDEALVGRRIQDIGIEPDQLSIMDRVGRIWVEDEPSYGVFAQKGSVILGITRSEASLYQEVNRSTFLLALYLTMVSLIMIAFISNYIDCYVVDGISSIHGKLEKITDNLKRVNDRYGHENGDRYLASIADILKSCAWDKCVAARLSGDEFALFLYGGGSRESLTRCVDQMLREMEESQVELDSNILIPVRFSAGYAFYPGDGTDVSGLLRKADEAMFEVKKRRRGGADAGGADLV